MNFTRLCAGCAFVLLNTAGYAQIWGEKQKLASSDGESNENFGRSVSISGDYAVVGAEQELEGEIFSAGAAYVFKRSESGEWLEFQKLVASDREEFEYFGYAVSISGNYLVVGARRETEPGFSNAGAAYIFELNESGEWIEIQKITASDRAPDTGFGACVSLSGENLLVADQAQSVYFFARDGEGTWAEVNKIESEESSTQFGMSVCLHDTYAAIGAPAENGFKGAVYLYQLNDGNWEFMQKITSEVKESFGTSVSVYQQQLIIGTPFRDVSNHSDAGGADIFSFNNTNNTWEFIQEVHASVPTNGAQAGLVSSISDNYAAIGTYFESLDANGENQIAFAGAAYMFHKLQDGSWSDAQKITHADRRLQDRFAASLALEGNLILIGAAYKSETTEHGVESFGAAYFFQACEEESQTVASCEPNYTWSVNGETYSEAGTYQAQISAGGNCTIHMLKLTFPSVDTQIAQNNNTLTASAASASFQWLDCNNDMIAIEGETAATFNVGESGSYAVEVTQNGCSKTSDCFPVIYLGVSENDLGGSLSVYPNPTSSSIKIELKRTMDNVTVTLLDILGKPVVLERYPSLKEANLSIPGKSGLYFMRITTAKGQAVTLKITKQ